MNNAATLRNMVRLARVGDTLQLRITRDGASKEIAVTLQAVAEETQFNQRRKPNPSFDPSQSAPFRKKAPSKKDRAEQIFPY